MRHLLAFILMIALVGSATAVDLGNESQDIKNNDHIGMNPGTADGRQGGEMGNPFVIDGIPFNDTGNTSGMADDYDVACPYTGSTAPDAWYSWTAATDILVDIDLCGSSYDTKVFVLVDGAEYACNDDAYFDDVCGNYVSLIEGMAVTAGVTYMIAVDGYGGDFGDYILTIGEYFEPAPCNLTCDGLPEGEPELMDGYQDAYNSGCGGSEFGQPWLDLTAAADNNGELVFCGISGWFDGYGHRDTDWMYFAIGETGMIEVTFDAEQSTNCYTLVGNCDDMYVDMTMNAGPCLPATMVIQGNPGNVIQLWVGPDEFDAPAGFVGHEYNYVVNFTGLVPGTVATENLSFGGIKSLYR